MPDASDVSAITTCKGRLAHLRETLPRLLRQGFREVVVVDYDCPEKSGDWAEANCPGATVVWKTEAPLYRCAQARNLGAAAASGPWLFFVDADIRVAPGLMAEVGPRLTEDVFAQADPLAKDCWGTLFVARADYDALGGYDEVMGGWGGEDDDLMWGLERLGRRRIGFPAALLDPILHSDAERLKYVEDVDRDVSGRRNGVYSLIKRGLIRQRGDLDLETRARLYAAVGKALGQGARAATFEIPIEGYNLYGVNVASSLRVQVTPEDP